MADFAEKGNCSVAEAKEETWQNGCGITVTYPPQSTAYFIARHFVVFQPGIKFSSDMYAANCTADLQNQRIRSVCSYDDRWSWLAVI